MESLYEYDDSERCTEHEGRQTSVASTNTDCADLKSYGRQYLILTYRKCHSSKLMLRMLPVCYPIDFLGRIIVRKPLHSILAHRHWMARVSRISSAFTKIKV